MAVPCNRTSHCCTTDIDQGLQAHAPDSPSCEADGRPHADPFFALSAGKVRGEQVPAADESCAGCYPKTRCLYPRLHPAALLFVITLLTGASRRAQERVQFEDLQSKTTWTSGRHAWVVAENQVATLFDDRRGDPSSMSASANTLPALRWADRGGGLRCARSCALPRTWYTIVGVGCARAAAGSIEADFCITLHDSLVRSVSYVSWWAGLDFHLKLVKR